MNIKILWLPRYSQLLLAPRSPPRHDAISQGASVQHQNFKRKIERLEREREIEQCAFLLSRSRVSPVPKDGPNTRRFLFRDEGVVLVCVVDREDQIKR